MAGRNFYGANNMMGYGQPMGGEAAPGSNPMLGSHVWKWWCHREREGQHVWIGWARLVPRLIDSRRGTDCRNKHFGELIRWSQPKQSLYLPHSQYQILKLAFKQSHIQRDNRSVIRRVECVHFSAECQLWCSQMMCFYHIRLKIWFSVLSLISVKMRSHLPFLGEFSRAKSG